MRSQISFKKSPILPKDKEVSIGEVDGGGVGLWMGEADGNFI